MLLRLALLAVVVVALSTLASPAFSQSDTSVARHLIAIELGRGSGVDRTDLLRLCYQANSAPLSLRGRSLTFSVLPEIAVGKWWGDQTIWNLGATPILRLQLTRARHGITPYFEGAVGFHYLSRTTIRGRNLATNFQFGDHLAIGVQLGKHRAINIAYKFQHLSNASIKPPNAGINFSILRIGYQF